MTPPEKSSFASNTPEQNALFSALESWGANRSDLIGELAGGASTRQFFRIHWGQGTAIVMYTPAPSQEIAKARQAAGSAPFIEVAALLERRGIRVPRLLAGPKDDTLLLVEDLGDDTLANYLLRAPDRQESLYQTAISDLARAQISLHELPQESIVRTRAFDAELLRWEVDHFRDWALEARGIKLSEADRATFERAADYLATTIASWPREFVHRDFQSRNLMVCGATGSESLCWIDFQDSMMGPRAYDLVALLTDSYQSFSREFVEKRLDEFCAVRGISSERERLEFEFDMVTVQRKLKDAGRFVFIDRVNKNPHFLPFVDATVQRARGALRRVRGHGPLAELEGLLNRVL